MNKNYSNFVATLQIPAANLFSDALGTPGGLDAFQRSGFGARQIIIGRRAEDGSALSPPHPPPLHHCVGGGGRIGGDCRGREGCERETFRRANIFKVTR